MSRAKEGVDRLDSAATSPPLSFGQERLWFLYQLDPEVPIYNSPQAFLLRGPLDCDVLERALSAIVARHEILRTTYHGREETPVQVVAPDSTLSFSVADYRGLGLSPGDSAVRKLLNDECRRCFDLSSDPMLRATVIRLREEEWILLLVVHHIATDAWSNGIILRELNEFYSAFLARRTPDIPELPLQYGEYALRQRLRFDAGEYREDLEYWKACLADPPAALQLPSDHPKPPALSYRGAIERAELPESLCERLRALSSESGVTLFMTLLAGFQTLLYRYCGEEDICVGITASNRPDKALHNLIGFFVNTLVMRTEASENPPFREFLRRVRKAALEAYPHRELPFEKLVAELQPERSLSHSPLFQVMLNFRNVPGAVLRLPGLEAHPIDVEAATSRFDLSLSITPSDQMLKLEAEYSTDLFERSTVSRLLSHYKNLLEAAVNEPDGRISSLPMLETEERHQLLFEWNDNSQPCRHSTFHELFEAQAAGTPEAIAVVSGERRLTYHELNQKANRLAIYLRELGVGLEAMVGICMSKSPEMIVSMLAVLKAGAAFLPLDPAYPSERLSFMVRDAGLKVILTQAEHQAKLRAHEIRLLCVDMISTPADSEVLRNPESGASPHNLACMIYTSGSTGKPNGVLLEHRGLVNFCESQIRDLGVRPDSRILQFASFSFDAAMFEITTALGSGAALYVPPPEACVPGPELIRFLEEQHISILFMPPSALAVLPAAQLADLKTLLVGGEICPAELVSRWGSDRNFVNVYGPTETSIWVCTMMCHAEDGKPPIGKPIPNLRVYILSDNFEPVPLGVPGELCIGGVGVGRGYHNRPELTAGRFMADPFVNQPGARLYRTGDRARFLPDGNIEFLDRFDNQVKIRGFRIEPGEIEAVIGEHEAVVQVAVVARMDNAGAQRLVAYVVRNKEKTCESGDLRNYLKERLPEYMLPSGVIFLDALPLTPSGKLNRRGLPSPDRSDLEPELAYVAPRNKVEELIAEIWAGVLGLEKVGIHDDFFEMGGHSLAATRIISRLRGAFGLEVPVRRLFETPTVAGLALLIERMGGGGGAA